MGLLNAAVGVLYRRRLRQLYRRATDPGPVQERVLAGLLRRARDTEWGRRYGFAAIRSVADFQRRVPLVEFEEVQPVWRRIEAGERDITWPGRTRYFALSAGTTRGSKHVPVTADAIRSNRRAGWDVIVLCLNQLPPDRRRLGKVLYLGGSTALRPSEVEPTPGVRDGPGLVGDASGIMNAHIPSFARRYHLPEPDIAAIPDWEEKIERICQRYLTAPVWMISALPSWAVPLFERLIEVGRERLGRHVRTVCDVWPGLSVLVSYGMAFEPYLPTLQALVGRPICYIDTYSSSEAGMTAIQDRQEHPAGSLPGMLVLPDNGVFYEFVPLEEIGGRNPRRLTLSEVEVGRPYEIVVSTNGGIWAYRLGDVVRFETLRPHRLVMAGRTRQSLSAFGEHLIAEELEVAVMAGCSATGAEVGNFAVEPVFPRAGGGEGRAVVDGPARHRWHIEFRRPPRDLEAFLSALDRRLTELNEDYASYRKGAIAPPEVISLSPGTFYEWMKRAGRLGGQFKIPRVLNDPIEARRLREISGELAANPSNQSSTRQSH